jgi:hypothetical protein
MLVTAFRSPATAAPFGASIPGSKFPACYFASRLAGSTTRSAFLLHDPHRFAPAWAASTLQARCGFLGSPDRLRFLPPLPFGSFTSLRIKAFSRVCSHQSAFRVRPISYRSPQPMSITRSPTPDQRSRSATFSEACCSSNLLEPFPICRESPFPSTGFVRWSSIFLKIYLFCF